MKFFLQTLGTGSADQTPVHGCRCSNCEKTWNSKDFRRKNCTNLIKYENITFFIDYGTHFILNTPIDFILLSHLHLDHLLGLFELKWSIQKKSIPLYIPQNTDLDYIKNFFDNFLLNYSDLKFKKKTPTIFEFKHYQNLEKIKIHNLEITPLPLNHNVPTSGFLISVKNIRFAYLLDTKMLPKSTMNFLLNFPPDIVLIDSSYPTNSVGNFHNSVKEAIDILIELNVSIGILTHIQHNVMLDQELKKYREQNPDKILDNIFFAKDNSIFDLANSHYISGKKFGR